MILLNEPEGFPEAAKLRLANCAPVVTPQDAFDPLLVEVVFIRLAENIDAAFLARFPNLRILVTPTTGLNHLDRCALEHARVHVISLAGQTAFLDTVRATAEHTIALALALLRQLPAATESVRKGKWNRYPFLGRELSNSTVLILGYGRVGRQVHQLYEAFGASVVAHDTVVDKVPNGISVPLIEGLGRADLVSVHVNLTPGSHSFFGARHLSQMKAGSILVNSSRGEILDQSAVFDSLRTGHLAGAALDVLCGEPAPLSSEVRMALRELGSRLLITPHISGFTKESLEKVENFMVQRLIELWHSDVHD